MLAYPPPKRAHYPYAKRVTFMTTNITRNTVDLKKCKECGDKKHYIDFRWGKESKCSKCRRRKRFLKEKKEQSIPDRVYRPSKVANKHKKDHCEMCPFVPKHECQLDVDHIDGNKYNNDPSNFQTLCANCHRLKTHINKDYNSKRTK